MPASLNAVHLIGRLGRDPEAFHIGQDTLARFNIATDDGYKSSDGQRVERVTWHTVTAHGATANFCLKYLHKGELVYVQGGVHLSEVPDKGRERCRRMGRVSIARAVPRRLRTGSPESELS